MTNKKQKKFWTNHRGLHFVEVLVVVAIISILALVGSQSWIYYLRKAKVTNLKTQFAGIYAHQSNYYEHHEMFHPDFECIGYKPQGFVDYNVGTARNDGPAYDGAEHKCNIDGADRCTGGVCLKAFSNICCHNRDDWINEVSSSTCKPHFTCSFQRTGSFISGSNPIWNSVVPIQQSISQTLYGGTIDESNPNKPALLFFKPEKYLIYGIADPEGTGVPAGYDIWTLSSKGGLVKHVQSP